MLLEFQYFAVDVVTGVSIEAGNQRISPRTSQSLPPTFCSYSISLILSCYIAVIFITEFDARMQEMAFPGF